VDGSPARPAWRPQRLAQERRGWDETVLTRKVAQLARIIDQLSGSNSVSPTGHSGSDKEGQIKGLEPLFLLCWQASDHKIW